MASKKTYPIEHIVDRYDYNPDTGHFVAKRNLAQRLPKGHVAASKTYNGYIQLAMGSGNTVRAHRAAYAVYYGRWPILDIDHINGDKTDNRICNLRETTRSINLYNRHKPWSCTGVLGVYPLPSGLYCARIGKRYLGSFLTLAEADACVKQVRQEICGLSARRRARASRSIGEWK